MSSRVRRWRPAGPGTAKPPSASACIWHSEAAAHPLDGTSGDRTFDWRFQASRPRQEGRASPGKPRQVWTSKVNIPARTPGSSAMMDRASSGSVSKMPTPAIWSSPTGTRSA